MKVGIKVKLVNHNLVKAIKENGFKNNAKFSRASKIAQTEIGRLVNLKSVPSEKTAKKLEKILHLPFEYLFPEDLIKEIRSKRQTDFYMSKEVTRLPDIPQNKMITFQEHSFNELKDDFEELMASLTEREEHVLKSFFGWEDEEKTLEKIANELGVCRDRVSQIRNKALRKLRHPTRAKLLKEHYENLTNCQIKQEETV